MPVPSQHPDRIAPTVRGLPDLVALVLCIAAGLALLGFIAHQPAPVPASSRPHRITEIPHIPFTDITTTAGIDFLHQNDARGEKLLPESMGGGVAFFDFNNDGAPDLLFVNSGTGPWNSPPSPDPPARNTLALYRNDGAGQFTNVTAGSGLDSHFYGMGVACGDYDNDGWTDLFVTGVGSQRLFKNLGGGRFADVTAAAGLQPSRPDWSTSAAWVDIDNDGLLDLFVCHYVAWNRRTDLQIAFSYDGRSRAYGPPRNFAGSHPALYHNDGGGRFTDISASAGIQISHRPGEPLAKALGVAPVDLDGDGWIDLVVANDTVQNLVFRNNRNRTFQEIGARTGVAFDAFGATRGAMGIDTARFRDDDALAIAIGNFANEMNGLYVTQSDPLHFADEAATSGIGPASRDLLKFGLFFFDCDLDGRLDVLTANGHLDPDIQKYQPHQHYRQPAQLFWNQGRSRQNQFLPASESQVGADLLRPIAGRGSAYADIDGDGDLDVILTQVNGPPVLLRNDQSLGHHWIRLRLVGATSNRDGIGAWVRIRSGSRIVSQQVMPTKGYLSQSEPILTLGLGPHPTIDDARVTWPGGRTQVLPDLRLDANNIVHEKAPSN